MVTVVDYKKKQNQNKEDFFLLVLQGEAEIIKSINTNKLYVTARRTSIVTTLDEQGCKALIGSKFSGTIKKVNCEEYDFIVHETNEVARLNYRYEYSEEEL